MLNAFFHISARAGTVLAGLFVSFAIPLAAHAAMTVTPDTLPSASVGVAYNQPLIASGAVAPTTWYFISGTRPTGIDVNPTGSISGTPTVAGTFTFTIGVDDSTTPTPQSQSKTYTLVVNPGLVVVTASIPNATASFSYSQTLTAMGGTTPYRWALVSGVLPSGLSLSTNGLISGTPSGTGDYTITVSVTDNHGVVAYKIYTLSLFNPMGINPASLPAAQANMAYPAVWFTATGTAPFTWTISSGSLPNGMTFSVDGVLGGTPTGSGSFSFTVQATDVSGNKGRRSYSFGIGGALSISPSTLPNGTQGSAYSQLFAANNGWPDYNFQLSPSTPGPLPPGLTLLTAGTLSGTPQASGSYRFRILVTDSQNHSGEQQYTLTINPVGGAGFGIETATLPNAVLNSCYTATFSLRDGSAPYTWRFAGGTMPPGLTFNQASGLIAGMASSTGSYTFTIQAMDATNAMVSRNYTIVVTSGGAPAPVVTGSVSFVSLGLSYHQLVKLEDDSNPATTEDTAVYYLGTDGKRHAFPNDKIYFSWYPDFSNVISISAANLSQIPLGGNVTYKPGVKMVKFTTDPKAYAVDRYGVLRWVKTEDLARAFYGDAWNTKIDDISDAFYSNYSFGADIASVSDFNPIGAASSVATISDSLPQ